MLLSQRLRGIFGQLLLSACVMAIPLLSGSAFGAEIEGRVVGVADGDTITVLDSKNERFKIRLTGIDAPEKKQAFGSRSREHLGKMLYGKVVVVDWKKRDRYQRILGKVLVNGTDANLEQIRSGLAWHYKKYKFEQSQSDRSLYSDAEKQAQIERRGLWGDKAPIAPWDFRHDRKFRKP